MILSIWAIGKLCVYLLLAFLAKLAYTTTEFPTPMPMEPRTWNLGRATHKVAVDACTWFEIAIY